MPDTPTRTVYVQQQQLPGGWQEPRRNRGPRDRDGALQILRPREGNALIERAERVLVQGVMRKVKR